MKRKFLSLALVSALFAFAITGVVSAQTGGLSPQVSVTGDTIVTISVAGQMASHTCTGIVAGDPLDNCYLYPSGIASNYLEVIDYTSTDLAGHRVSVKFDNPSWTYTGPDPGYGTVAVSASTGSADAIKYGMRNIANTGSDYVLYDTRTGATCTPGTVAGTDLYYVNSNFVLLASSGVEFIKNGNSCPAKWHYKVMQFSGTAGTNGLGEGSYTNSATYTLLDGTT